MEKLPKYYLSLLLLATLFISCGNDISKMTAEERKQQSLALYQEAESLHIGQGSPAIMTKLQEAAAMDPTNCDAVRELSVAYLKRGMIDEWKPKFDKAVACNPKIWVPWRGYLYLQFYRDYEKAIADFNASDTLTPNFKDAPQGQSVDYWRGIAYLGLIDYETSVAYFDEYIETITAETGEDWAEPTAFLYKGIALFKDNQLTESEKAIDTYLKYTRGITADGHYYKAALLLKNGYCEAARKSILLATSNFEAENFYKHDYTEVLHQLYAEDIQSLSIQIDNCLTIK
jgi:tetratricopeptide (TPR) repeat protein